MKISFYYARDSPGFFHFYHKSANNISTMKGNLTMKTKFMKAMTLCLALLMSISCSIPVSAAEVADATIDMTKTASLTIYNYDLSQSEKDGVWDSSYVSTGTFDQTILDTLGGDDANTLGNSDTSYGYAIAGTGFSYLKVADIVQYTEANDDNISVLYAVDKTAGADFLAALGLEDGAQRYEKADALDESKYFYVSDTLVAALSDALDANSTDIKNALETYVKNNGGVEMSLTDAYGKTVADELPLGLYTVVTTSVPETVTSGTAPFLISLPMTSVNGTNATDGGTRWIYDVTVYPKALTGIPTLEKTVKETTADTGKTESYAHTDTASSGDTLAYQITSTLPTITSESTYLTTYTFVDTLSKGLTYQKNDVVLTFYKDSGCTEKITTWAESDGKFSVIYNTSADGESVMTIEMTADGLAEINAATTVYTEETMLNSGYSDCTLRIDYNATLDSDSSTVFGDSGNPNTVVLTWRRTSSNYYDTLIDDCHIYSYGVDLTKLFSDGQGDFSKVSFILHNDTDDYFVKAELDEATGIYYVIDHVAEEADATVFVPIENESTQGKIIVKGMEDDTYSITETATDSGYTLLKEDIILVISQSETSGLCDVYSKDTLGLVQNDPRFAETVNEGNIHSAAQKHLEHHHLTAAAKVDGKKVTMTEDNSSANALAPLSVNNVKGFDLPATGDNGTAAFTIIGVVLMVGAAAIIFMVLRKKQDC